MTLQQISLAMIVRNEDTRLAQCLESVKDAVDEIVIVDTGSSDTTVDIAQKYTTKIYSYQWNDDFAAARNYAIEQTTGDWVLSLDADEQLSIDSGALNLLVNQSEYTAFCLPLCALKTCNEYREYDRFMVLRLFRRNYRFTNPVHEYVSIDDPTTVGYTCHPVIWHTAVSTSERRTRRGRNIRLLKTAIALNNTDPYLHYYLGTEWLGVSCTDLAIAAFQVALRQFATAQTVFRTPAVRHLISCYKQSVKLDEAIRLCLEESEHYPEYCDLFFDGAVLFELQGEYALAIKWFQEAIRLGPPPLTFFHTDGTDSYLAYYHLGYCSEKLSLIKEAEKYYEQALATSQNYYYPLYPLVLLKLTQQPALEVLRFLREQDYLEVSEVAGKMAELFWTAGFPDIGVQCLEPKVAPDARELEILVTCQLYSGEIAGALQSILQMRQQGIEPSTTVAVDEIVALMLLDRYEEARLQMWSLWQKPDNRDVFRAVFCLYKKLCHNASIPLANPQATATLLALSNRCLQVRTKDFSKQRRFAAVIAAIKGLLANDAESLALVIHELSVKEQGVRQSLDYTFSTLRGLYQ
ncbi:tetratricopeptide repeat-containing glycosyltransferase family 2 protein [Sporomusa sp.]|uniref:tetratricopeptide repeat-containing glycosyltransferase family 2 protein n=1 Tax=Sporomusa sp. TaxID=2078658 RepID=UPI002B9792F2|nr:glycosyltransferase [Sporomusa sp.]HWR45116.1 glycosyltransferase [Sporomusa sp.]